MLPLAHEPLSVVKHKLAASGARARVVDLKPRICRPRGEELPLPARCLQAFLAWAPPTLVRVAQLLLWDSPCPQQPDVACARIENRRRGIRCAIRYCLLYRIAKPN